MDSSITFEMLLNAQKIRLGDLFYKISDIFIYRFEYMSLIYKKIENKPHKKLEIDNPETLDLESEFSLQNVKRLSLICNHNGRISFCVSKETFILYFENFYYPRDEIIVIEIETNNPICYLDHEEFALIPTMT